MGITICSDSSLIGQHASYSAVCVCVCTLTRRILVVRSSRFVIGRILEDRYKAKRMQTDFSTFECYPHRVESGVRPSLAPSRVPIEALFMERLISIDRSPCPVSTAGVRNVGAQLEILSAKGKMSMFIFCIVLCG